MDTPFASGIFITELSTDDAGEAANAGNIKQRQRRRGR
jgi:hypothetical protein